MSGLRGLVVWKQKATTDAPDTKSQAKKNQVLGLALSTAYNTKFWSE
ncbi:hypothetical protein ALO83_103830 [Pseudomonas cannabina pv. alisalensis]|uniref:Uncharacterized protein n=1 Tax=Pseudomonas cannabina TaxID=86840 RepID=A0A3M3SA84_PSECA|nr:hypothetical protein ALO83_103830 [Pseudomonas cannabina pv. alisalensis]RMN77520.1 hypothetical protein ALQ52_104518 [Pseudomonas cannabina pv. alisalensis]RMN85070.1 hypothetical protein ALQ53_103571 [Pseudomonas cannabina]RMO05604.1 hypothetical protein ALQ51_102224 [Pseudomonas cannabina]